MLSNSITSRRQGHAQLPLNDLESSCETSLFCQSRESYTGSFSPLPPAPHEAAACDSCD